MLGYNARTHPASMFQAGDVVREVIQEAVNQLDSGNPCVLATVVRTKGSTPQKAGAMLLVREDGTAVGTLGGGCVEGDIWFAAREILRNQGGPEFKDYYLNEDIAARDGLVCGGTMYFYLEPFWDTDDFSDIGNELIGAYDGAEPAALATIVRSDGDTAKLGAKLLLRSDGSVAGGIGTAELDEMALEVASRVAAVGANESRHHRRSNRAVCGGFHHSAHSGHGRRRARWQSHR